MYAIRSGGQMVFVKGGGGVVTDFFIIRVQPKTYSKDVTCEFT